MVTQAARESGRRDDYGALAGGTRRFVACSNAYASSIRRGSLHAVPAKLTPKGEGFASNACGMGGGCAFATMAKGTMTVGYPGLADRVAPDPAGHRIASSLSARMTSSMPCAPDRAISLARSIS